MCIFFQATLSEAYGYTGKGGLYFMAWLLVLVSVNAILEAASSLVIGTAVCNALYHALKK